MTDQGHDDELGKVGEDSGNPDAPRGRRERPDELGPDAGAVPPRRVRPSERRRQAQQGQQPPVQQSPVQQPPIQQPRIQQQPIQQQPQAQPTQAHQPYPDAAAAARPQPPERPQPPRRAGDPRQQPSTPGRRRSGAGMAASGAGGGRGGRGRGNDPYYDDYGGYDRGSDWVRMAVGALASVVLVLGIVVLGVYLFNQVDGSGGDGSSTVADAATSTPVPTVDVYYCAGDQQAFRQQVAPAQGSVVGRTIDSRWLAFGNPDTPPRQLWIRATDLPGFDTRTVGTVPCAATPEEFPTPIGFTDPNDITDGGADEGTDGGDEGSGEDSGEDDGAVVTATDGAADGPTPIPVPTNTPAPVPTADPNAPTPVPATPVPVDPTAVPTEEPTAVPTEEPTAVPTEEPTAVPTAEPTTPPVIDDDNPRGDGSGGDDLGGDDGL